MTRTILMLLGIFAGILLTWTVVNGIVILWLGGRGR
jgi:hypothetical protein